MCRARSKHEVETTKQGSRYEIGGLEVQYSRRLRIVERREGNPAIPKNESLFYGAEEALLFSASAKICDIIA